MFFILWLAIIILDIFAMSDVLKSNRDTTSKAVLLILILISPVVGAAIYLFAFRDKGF